MESEESESIRSENARSESEFLGHATSFPTYAPEAPPEHCPGCSIAATQAAHRDAPATCADCGSSWEPEAPVAPPRAIARAPRPPRSLRADVALRSVVAELLAWDYARHHCGARAQRSSVAGVLEVLRSGIVGDGCSGTKGTWRGGAAEVQTRVVPVSDATGERYAALPPRLQAIADAVLTDGGGCSLRPLTILDAASESGRGLALELGLEARIGWRLASEGQREKWLKKIVRKDRAPAIAGMEQCGSEALARLLLGWTDPAKAREIEDTAQAQRELDEGAQLWAQAEATADALIALLEKTDREIREQIAKRQREAIARECREAVGR